MESVRNYLDVGAIYLNEGPHLREWIEFHRMVGVERFFMYDNGSTDDHLEVLAPYVDDGIVVLDRWPMEPGCQQLAYSHCLETHRDESRWIAFIDLDEYLFCPSYEPLPEVLKEYERHPGVVVSWCIFGTSGHLTKPAGLTIEEFGYRTEYPPGSAELVKWIVDPARTERSLNAHRYALREGTAVNENHDVREGGVEEVTFERLRLNHYAHRSREEYVAKLARPMVGGKVKDFPAHTLERRINRANAVRDDTIKSYIPALRERLAAAEKRARPLGAESV
jgi:hypothetical protein